MFSEAQEGPTLDTGVELVLNISPTSVEAGERVHEIGFIHLVHETGGPVFARDDYRILLESSDPEIVSVPQEIFLEKNDQYVKFDVTTKDLIGDAIITATLGR